MFGHLLRACVHPELLECGIPFSSRPKPSRSGKIVDSEIPHVASSRRISGTADRLILMRAEAAVTFWHLRADLLQAVHPTAENREAASLRGEPPRHDAMGRSPVGTSGPMCSFSNSSSYR